MPQFRAEAVVVPEVVDERAPRRRVDVLGAGDDDGRVGVDARRALGATLFHHALDRHWLTHHPTTRIVTVTPAGHQALRERWGVAEEALRGVGEA
ncbi:hypothetical protein ACIBBD_08140 [Streptomyces sp. NPDC051315]|uniref:hypothetical protein n=1 Tax=Streptomyces sp. NPDC051315 TaxID=3365650 RepID=UPI0037BD1CF1